MEPYFHYSLGNFAEEATRDYLQSHGLNLLSNNYCCRFGEIDLIMRDKEVLVFIEVKVRSDQNFERALESVTAKKRSKIIKTAAFYLQKHHLLNKVACRFDVVAVIRNKGNFEFQWIKNAFDIGSASGLRKW